MLSCLFYNNMAQGSAKTDKCCGSSVVEHSLGKGEVESSILSRSTIPPASSLLQIFQSPKSSFHPKSPSHSHNRHQISLILSDPRPLLLGTPSRNRLTTGTAQSSTPSTFSLPTQSASRTPPFPYSS